MTKVVTPSSRAQDELVTVNVKYSLLFPRKPELSSSVGVVMNVGRAVTELDSGNWVIAHGTPQKEMKLLSDDCLVVDVSEVTETHAFWGFCLSIIPVIRSCNIEIGEKICVIGTDLVGHLAAELALLSGALKSILFNPYYPQTEESISIDSPGNFRLVSDLEGLDDVAPEKSIDLLIDASDDPSLLLSNLHRVCDSGRILSIGIDRTASVDFNIYKDLHRRSLNVFTCQLSNSFGEITKDLNGAEQSMASMVKFFNHIFAIGSLNPVSWPVKKIKNAVGNGLVEALNSDQRCALLVEW